MKHGYFDDATRERLATATLAAPDPYRAELAALKATAATPSSRFEDQYRAARRREFGLKEPT